jgi:hypothetical protein
MRWLDLFVHRIDIEEAEQVVWVGRGNIEATSAAKYSPSSIHPLNGHRGGRRTQRHRRALPWRTGDHPAFCHAIRQCKSRAPEAHPDHCGEVGDQGRSACRRTNSLRQIPGGGLLRQEIRIQCLAQEQVDRRRAPYERNGGSERREARNPAMVTSHPVGLKTGYERKVVGATGIEPVTPTMSR